MTLSLLSFLTAIRPGLPVSFTGVDGTPPYIYSVSDIGDIAGGTINSTTGIYTAPAQLPESPKNQYDTIIVTDSDLNIASKKIMVASPILLLLDIIKKYMSLDDNHIYLWNQKLKEPDDYSIYIVLSNPYSTPFANNIKFDPETNQNILSTNEFDIIDINAYSRGPVARDKKSKVLKAINCQYSQQQQSINSFRIGQLPFSRKFNDLSGIDGAAIPYRYQISISLTYSTVEFENADYYDTFEQSTLLINP